MIHGRAMIHVNYPCHDTYPEILRWLDFLYRRDKLFPGTLEYALQYAHTS